MSKKPIILAKAIVAKSKLFCIESLDLQFSNGEQRQYERLARSQTGAKAVLIVPLLDNETVLLIREYAAGLERYELGLPKGKVDAGETILEAANRELKEEIGYGAKKLQILKTLSVAPSYLEHCIEVVIAQDLYPEKLQGDEPEELEVVAWNMQKLTELFNRDDCTEARSIAALYLTKEYLKNDC